MLSLTLIFIILLAITFDFINGFHDTANSIATSVSTRVLSPRTAIMMAASLNFLGALISEKVAKTFANGLVDNSMIVGNVIIAALIAGIIWDLCTWYYGIPSSSSHALFGGLIGAAVAYSGSFKIVIWDGVIRVLSLFLISPILGFLLGYLFMNILNFLLRSATPHFVNRCFSKLQIFSAAWMSYSHGGNDAQKSMGIITLALISAKLVDKNASIPLWVMVICAMAMCLGTSIGGWRIIKTMGVSMIRLQPINGFAAETGAALVIEAASAIGAPLSTTHVISSAIMGVGASKRLSAVKWALAKNIIWAWILTIPITSLLGAAVALILKFYLH
ncbi:MAG TPA: anion permease [Firmicutes bacterium]|jgi:inorganic phosphate transporter, PiT family|nr:anion permease [Bacillota bacterium]